MKNVIAFGFGVAAMAAVLFATIGVMGVADGCDDDCTRAFVKIIRLID